MQGALFLVKSNHDVADVTKEAAKEFCEEPPRRTPVSNLCAGFVHHLDLACHFAGCGTIFAHEEDRIGSVYREVEI
jgi:hypothetical protein